MRKNGRQSFIWDFISAKFVMGDYPCVGLHTRYYIHDPTIVHCLPSYVNVTKLLKINMAAKRPFCNFLLPNVHQVIG